MSTLTFQYRAVDKAGVRHKGELPAVNEGEAFRKVSAMGLTPVGLRTVRAKGTKRGWGAGGGISTRDLAHFTYQLGVLVSSRIPLSDGLRSISEQEKEGRLKDVVNDVAKRIESGEQVAQAMEAHKEVFGEVYIETLRASEKSGTLTRALEHLSENLERGQEMRQQVRGALMYPLCVSGILCLAMMFLIGFVVPTFAKMFEQRNVELPMFTKALMLFGKTLQGYWFLYAAAIAGAVFGMRHVWRTPKGRMAIDQFLGKVPSVGKILRGLAVCRFTRVLGLSISSGLGLIEALDLAGRASGSATLKRDAERMSVKVRGGGRLTEALPECKELSGFAQRMLTAGEQSAELPKMCTIIARHYERETTHLVKNISTVIEPVLIVAIAGVVLVVALAIFMPMWDMVKIVG